jgi:hypothetical protein
MTQAETISHIRQSGWWHCRCLEAKVERPDRKPSQDVSIGDTRRLRSIWRTSPIQREVSEGSKTTALDSLDNLPVGLVVIRAAWPSEGQDFRTL